MTPRRDDTGLPVKLIGIRLEGDGKLFGFLGDRTDWYAHKQKCDDADSDR